MAPTSLGPLTGIDDDRLVLSSHEQDMLDGREGAG
ncbi:hypothetical protein LQK93_01221 [Terrabacter sp. BE26]